MILERTAKSTLTPCGLNHGDSLHFTLHSGAPWEMTLLDTTARVLASDYAAYQYRDGGHESGDISVYGMRCVLRVNGRELEICREVGAPSSFYEPVVVDGVSIWFDAASCAFRADGGFMAEKDWREALLCKPNHKARLVVQEADRPICPEPLHPWFPNPARRLDIRDCYNGEDCWMGPYGGAAAHCGLDVNMPAGTVLSAPISVDDQRLFTALSAGYANNRWRGVRRWPDGAQWELQCHHQIDMLVPEGTPLRRGTPYATGAGVAVGAHQHSHFVFRVIEQGGTYMLDPWILFWATYRA